MKSTFYKLYMLFDNLIYICKKLDPLIISSIVAVAENNVIGLNGQIPWYSSTDFKYFKKVTMGHPLIMGRNCFESIGRPLPGRLNVIISRDPYYVVSGAVVVHSVDEALAAANQENTSEVFVIGGGQIYGQTEDLWDKLYYTQIHANPDGDTFFTDIDWSYWRLISEQYMPLAKNDEVACTFKIYERVHHRN